MALVALFHPYRSDAFLEERYLLLRGRLLGDGLSLRLDLGIGPLLVAQVDDLPVLIDCQRAVIVFVEAVKERVSPLGGALEPALEERAFQLGQAIIELLPLLAGQFAVAIGISLLEGPVRVGLRLGAQVRTGVDPAGQQNTTSQKDKT